MAYTKNAVIEIYDDGTCAVMDKTGCVRIVPDLSYEVGQVVEIDVEALDIAEAALSEESTDRAIAGDFGAPVLPFRIRAVRSVTKHAFPIAASFAMALIIGLGGSVYANGEIAQTMEKDGVTYEMNYFDRVIGVQMDDADEEMLFELKREMRGKRFEEAVVITDDKRERGELPPKPPEEKQPSIEDAGEEVTEEEKPDVPVDEDIVEGISEEETEPVEDEAEIEGENVPDQAPEFPEKGNDIHTGEPETFENDGTENSENNIGENNGGESRENNAGEKREKNGSRKPFNRKQKEQQNSNNDETENTDPAVDDETDNDVVNEENKPQDQNVTESPTDSNGKEWWRRNHENNPPINGSEQSESPDISEWQGQETPQWEVPYQMPQNQENEQTGPVDFRPGGFDERP